MSERIIKRCPVAVVGGAGFLGSHLVDHLIKDRGCEVHVIDNLSVGRREFVNPAAHFYHHDITGSEQVLRDYFRLKQIRYVFNYAAMPYVPDSYAHPLRVMDVNAIGAMKVINAATEAVCEAVLQVSSAEVYGDAGDGITPGTKNGKIDETTAVKPHSSYGSAKAAIDAWCQVRWKEAGARVIALRQFNCVGARETHPYVIPEIISQVYAQVPWTLPDGTSLPGADPAVIRLGNNSRRDFMWAGDAVRGAVLLLERGQFGEVYNLGSEESVNVYDLVLPVMKCMSGLWKTPPAWRIEKDPTRVRPWEIWHLQSDNTKFREAVGGWAPTTGLSGAVLAAVNDFRSRKGSWPWERPTRREK